MYMIKYLDELGLTDNSIKQNRLGIGTAGYCNVFSDLDVNCQMTFYVLTSRTRNNISFFITMSVCLCSCKYSIKRILQVGLVVRG